MTIDSWGNALSATQTAHIAALNGFTHGLLSYEQTLLPVLAQADGDTVSPNTLLQTYAAVLWLLSESSVGAHQASVYLERARQGLANALPRETLNFSFVEAWVSGDLTQALRLSDALLAAYPRDLTAVKLRHYIDFNLGHFTDLLRIGLAAQVAAPDVAYVHGMTAFAYEQCHLMDEAETAARRALDLLAKEPWAQHALAHVMLTEGRIDEGADFLESVSDQWGGLNSFMYTHLWWHFALFRLSQGRAEEALALYDRHVWGIEPGYSQDQIGAVSLLARLEFSGVAVGERWQDVATYLASRTQDVVEPFLSLQYLYGLQRAGRDEAKVLLSAIEVRAQTAIGPAQSAWRDCTVPLAHGIVAALTGRAGEAIDFIRQGLPWLNRIGGSHAQRDLFDQILLQALIDDGRDAEAQQILEQRRLNDPYGVPLNQQLANVYDRLGLPVIAAQARTRVAQRLSGKEVSLWG